MALNENQGMWVVCITGQGGGTIDEVDGPYWTKTEALEVAAAARAKVPWRRDRYEVALLTMVDDDDGFGAPR